MKKFFKRLMWPIFYGFMNIGFLRTITDLCPNGALYARILVATMMTVLLAILVPIGIEITKYHLKK